MLARLGDFAAGSGIARRWRRYERREDGTRRCAAGRRFLFVAPFSVAHPCRQEKGIRLLFFSFATSCLLPAFSCPYHPVVSYRLRPVEASYSPCVAWGDMPRRVGGVIWLLVSRPVLSSRSAARSISSYRLAGRMRAPFLSVHSPASFVGGWSYRFPFRLVPRLACPSRVGVSCLFFAARSSIRFISSICQHLGDPFCVSCSRLALRSVSFVSCYPSRSASRQAVRILSFRPGVSSRRLAGRVGFSLSPVSFSSVLVSSHSFVS